MSPLAAGVAVVSWYAAPVPADAVPAEPPAVPEHAATVRLRTATAAAPRAGPRFADGVMVPPRMVGEAVWGSRSGFWSGVSGVHELAPDVGAGNAGRGDLAGRAFERVTVE